jgi:hypothetical protein
MEHGKTSQGKFGTYLHLGAAVLEPELDLARLQAELPAQRRPLVLVGVRALLEHPVHVQTRRTPLLHPMDHQKNWITQLKTNKKSGEEGARTPRAVESGAGCGGGTACGGAGCRSPQVRRRNPWRLAG